MKKEEALKEYIRDMNGGTKYDRVISYLGDVYATAYNLIITFKPDQHQRERYNLLLKVCAENNITVIATEPGTLKTTVRIDG